LEADDAQKDSGLPEVRIPEPLSQPLAPNLVSTEPDQGHHHDHDSRDAHGNPADLARYIEKLESLERAEWQKPDRVIASLGLRPGQVVADLGAGPGYFSLRLARKVGKQGRVFAVDVEPAILGVLRERIAARKLAQITPVLALPNDPLLPPASCDVVLSANAYHHIKDRPAALRRMAHLLRRGGRVALIDFHKRESAMGPPLADRVSREEVLEEIKRAGLKVANELTFLPHHYFFVIKR
jgi:ubiquinone/menaquinone biosynthesis C-methylase UbiE